MKKRQWAIFVEYIRFIADDIGLRDWTFNLEEEPPESDDARAWIEPIYGRKFASIRVTAGFDDLSPEDQRHAIVHELIHCHLHPMSEVVRVDLADANVLRQSEYELIMSSFKRATEYACDGLAVDIAKKYPLIDWKNGG